MKSIVIVFLAAIGLSAQAQTTVPIVWPFALGSTQGVMVREIVQEANNQQKKYQFVLDHKPGGGGAVAVNHVSAQRGPTVLAHTNSYFIRPHVSQEGAYDVDLFNLISAYCENQPLAVFAKNLTNLADLDKKSSYTIGIIPGSITQLVSSELSRQNPRQQFTEVGFKGTPEITLSMLGDHIDLSVDFLASVVDDRLKVLGITGIHPVGQHKTFRSQGIAGFDNLTNSYYLLVSRSTDPTLASELSTILARAAQNVKVQELCRKDFGQPSNISGSSAQKLFNDRKDFWARQVKSVPRK